MWPFRDVFMRALQKRARQQFVCRQPEEDRDERTMDTIDCDAAGFYTVRLDDLGVLCALVLAQAQADGATRVKLHYAKNRMIYTLADVDYEMVPLASPASVDLVRALAKAAGMRWGEPGALPVRFADRELLFAIEHKGDMEDPYIEITGFTGEPRINADGVRPDIEPVVQPSSESGASACAP